MTQHRAVHSGSRWEPWPDPATGSDAPASRPAEAAPVVVGAAPRRGPALALLVTLVTLGTASAGVAYVQTNESPSTGTAQVRSQPGPVADRGRRGSDGRPDGDRRLARGAADRDGVPSVRTPS